MIQIMHITLISTGSVLFKFGFDFFLTFLYVWGFLLFSFFFKVNSGVFLHNSVVTVTIVQVPLAYISSLVLTFFKLMYVWGFLLFSVFFLI